MAGSGMRIAARTGAPVTPSMPHSSRQSRQKHSSAGKRHSAVYSRGVFSRMSNRAFFAMGFGLLALYCLALPLCTRVWMILLAQLLGGASRTLLYTQLMALCPAKVEPGQKTTAVGVFQSRLEADTGTCAGNVNSGDVVEKEAGFQLHAARFVLHERHTRHTRCCSSHALYYPLDPYLLHPVTRADGELVAGTEF